MPKGSKDDKLKELLKIMNEVTLLDDEHYLIANKVTNLQIDLRLQKAKYE